MSDTVSERWEMAPGQTWAYRAKAFDPDCPIAKVEVLKLEPKGHKTRIRWLEGEYEGLDEWVPRVRLRFLWDERDVWLRDEAALGAALKASDGAEEQLWYKAADVVFGAYPSRGIWLHFPSGVVTIAEPEAVARDLGVDMSYLLSFPLSFVNRDSEYVAPAAVAEPIARLVCERHSTNVLMAVERDEDEVRKRAVGGHHTDRGYVPPERYVEYLRGREPVFALVREWCGEAAMSRFNELTALRAENARLREMVADAAARLKESGHPQVAARLRRALGMRS